MYRLYIWFLGIEEDRPTGPWWQFDFPSYIACSLFLADCLIYLQAYAIVPEEAVDKEEIFIKPPNGAKIIYPSKQIEKWEKV